MSKSSRIFIKFIALMMVSGQSFAGGMKLKVDTGTIGDFARDSQYDWSGFYTGGSLDYTARFRGTGQLTDEGYSTLQPRGQGPKGGAYAGYNIQVNSVVLGIEADLSYGWNKDSRSTTGMFYSLNTTTNIITSQNVPLYFKYNQSASYALRARLGYAFDNILLFTSLGPASTSARFAGQIIGSTTTTDASNNTVSVSKLYTGSTRNVSNGYNFGLGIEYGINSNLVVRAEYMYLNYDLKSPNWTYNYRIGLQEHDIRTGMAYKF